MIFFFKKITIPVSPSVFLRSPDYFFFLDVPSHKTRNMCFMMNEVTGNKISAYVTVQGNLKMIMKEMEVE